MIRRSVVDTLGSRVAGLVLAAAACMSAPAAAQLARPRVPAADALKLLVLPFVRDAQDSALSLSIADAVRERLRTNHLDKFNTIPRNILCQNLQESGFQCDVPLEPATIRQLNRFMNVKLAIEASMIRRPNDSILIVARLYEAQGNNPQATSTSLMASASRSGNGAGNEIVNRLVAGYRTFDEVADCRRRLDAGDVPGARTRADAALRQFPGNAGAYLCIAQILERQNAPADSVIAALRSAYERDTLNTQTMRSLSLRYQAKADTAQLLNMLKRILTIDFRDNDLRISTIRLLVQMGQVDSALAIANQGLAQNPASTELLSVKGLAMAAASRWDSAFALFDQVAQIDTSKVDSLFVYRITNYARQIPDTTNWLRWVAAATVKFPSQLDYWYTLASQRLARADTTGAIEATQGLLSHLPADAATATSPAMRGYFARGHFMIASVQNGRGQPDSALAHAELAVQADSSMKPSVAVIYLIVGGRERGDTANAETMLPRAIEHLQKAKDYAGTNTRIVVPAAFQLGIAQFLWAVRIDTRAQAERSCDLVRQAQQLITDSEANIIVGVAVDRRIANDFLSTYIPQYKSREETMARNYCR